MTTTIIKPTSLAKVGDDFPFLANQTFIDNFWNRVDSSGGPDTCWPWVQHKHKKGYGEVQYLGKIYLTHRVAYVLTYGSIDKNALHTCDNNPCCNPKHLYDGTQHDNLIDAYTRKRRVKSKGRPRMPVHKREQIKNTYGILKSYSKAAKQHGVGRSTVARIVGGLYDES